MKYPTVSVNGVSVRVDDEGRYNLNDLHAAAVANGEATEQQRPSQFLRSAQIKRFIKALKAKVQKKALWNKFNHLKSKKTSVYGCWLWRKSIWRESRRLLFQPFGAGFFKPYDYEASYRKDSCSHLPGWQYRTRY